VRICWSFGSFLNVAFKLSNAFETLSIEEFLAAAVYCTGPG
jgi:hypothetical protein